MGTITMDSEEDCSKFWPETTFAKKVFLHSIVEADKREKELERYYHACESKDILHSCDQHGNSKKFSQHQQEDMDSRERIEQKRKNSKKIKNGDPWGPFSPNLRINGLQKLK